jgi:uncharacterized RDD family membrane protein YckC
MTTPVPGWYPAPDRVGQMRHWDGVQWTDQYQPAAPVSAPSAGASPSYRPEEQWWPAPAMGSEVRPDLAPGGGPTRAYASFWGRAGASIVDTLILFTGSFVLRATLGALIYTIYSEVDDATLFVVLELIGYPLYFAALWWFYTTGWSPGRALVGIRIVDGLGSRPGARRGLGRLLMSFVSTMILGVGYLAMLWSPTKQTWHDGAAGTYVVRVR